MKRPTKQDLKILKFDIQWYLRERRVQGTHYDHYVALERLIHAYEADKKIKRELKRHIKRLTNNNTYSIYNRNLLP